MRRVAQRKAGLHWRDKKALDELARTVVMLRAGAVLIEEDGRRSWVGNCQKCGRWRGLSWCHVFTRAALSVRWDPENAFAWCSGCHRHMDQHWEEKREYTIDRLGEAGFDALRMRSRPGRRPDYSAIRVSLELERREIGPFS